jgi:hypothetical protein
MTSPPPRQLARLVCMYVLCICSLKITYTTVVYLQHRLPALAFVIPSNGTKQAFDDIGFIVVERGRYSGIWTTIDLINRNRTGEGYQWFDNWNLSFGPSEFKVIGYAIQKAS